MITANESIKKYFSVLDDALNEINQSEEFYKVFINAIKSGNNTLYSKLIKETRVFDDKWVKYIEEAIPALDTIIRDPRSFIRVEREVVAVERAKKVDSQSIKHLSVNSQFIKDVTEDGDVVPHKILTPYSEEDIAIYENRFIKSLIEKLYFFVDRRYQLIKQSKPSNYLDQLKVNSSFKWYKTDVDIELNINVREDIEGGDSKTLDLLERIEKIRKYAVAFKNSMFMKALAHAKPVRPPIMKTNILLKNVHYKQAYKLWLFLDMYNTLGFDVLIEEKNLPFNGTYIEDIYNLIIANYATMFVNQDLGELDYDLSTFRRRRLRRPKVVRQLDLSNLDKPDEIQMEDTRISEFFYQKTHQIYSDQYKGLISEGITKKEALRNIMVELLELVNNIYDEFIDAQIKEERFDKLFEGDLLAKSKIKLREQRYRLEMIKLLRRIKEREYKKVLQEEKKLMRAIKQAQEKLTKDVKKAKERERRKALREKERKARAELLKKQREEKAKKERELKRKQKTTKKVTKPKDTKPIKVEEAKVITTTELKKTTQNIVENVKAAETKKEIKKELIHIDDPQLKGVNKEGIEIDDMGNLTELGLKEIRRRRLEKIAQERRKRESKR